MNLLFAIANDVRYRFDRVQLKKGAYSPQAHGDMLLEQSLIRRMSVELLAGERSLKMDVASFPVDAEAVRSQVSLNESLARALNGGNALSVHVKERKPVIEGSPD